MPGLPLAARGPMSFAVFSVPTEHASVIKQVLADDLVSRQSISQRDGKALGLDDKAVFLLIEGSSESFAQAEKLFGEVAKRLPDAEASRVRDTIKQEEEGAAEGVGFIFG